MDDHAFKTLELDELISLLARHAQTPLGRSRALALRPISDLAQINRALDRTTEATRYLANGGGFGMTDISDPTGAISQLQIEGASLDAHQILAMERLLSVGLGLREQFREAGSDYPQLAACAAQIPDVRHLLKSIRGRVLPSGEIDDNASPELYRIRREIKHRRARIYHTLEAIMRAHPAAIQEEVVTIRNDRFVIPVRTDSRGMVPGVVHGLSSSGQTVYVEPLSVIDQNNELVRLSEQEQIEIAQILFCITEALRENLASLRAIINAIAEFDFAQAKAKLSLEFKCVRPQSSQGRRLLLVDARHPLLEHALKRSGGGRVVPISLEMDEAHQVMVISGPNAGGKTVALKTIGLIALMAQMGLHVPAAEAVLPVFAQVFADIGDQQSIAANLSTFTAHMRSVSEIAKQAIPPALVLIDEVGTGTDPDEGAALGVAIVDYFRRRGITTIVTTHYNELKMWASQTEGVLNASVEFDDQTLAPTYRLIVGLAGASSGLEIAQRMSVPQEIIDQAKGLLDPTHNQAAEYLKRLKALAHAQEQLCAALSEERQATAEKYARLEREFAKREAERQAQFESELAQIISEFELESKRLINDLKDRALAARLKKEAEARAAELRRSAAARLRKQNYQLSATRCPDALPITPLPQANLPADLTEINERDRVLIKTLGREGIVEHISGDVYTVRVGSLRFHAKRGELLKAASPPAQSPGGVSAAVKVDEQFSEELNVIGLTVDEATRRVDKFLDEAYLAGAESVRIIHGHGKGALRRAIAELLTGHPHVEGFSHAPQDKGGRGVTVVEMRK
jgi:DNA mismatch repair protein MutS2